MSNEYKTDDEMLNEAKSFAYDISINMTTDVDDVTFTADGSGIVISNPDVLDDTTSQFIISSLYNFVNYIDTDISDFENRLDDAYQSEVSDMCDYDEINEALSVYNKILAIYRFIKSQIPEEFKYRYTTVIMDTVRKALNDENIKTVYGLINAEAEKKIKVNDNGVESIRFYTKLQSFNIKNRNGRIYEGPAMLEGLDTPVHKKEEK